MLAVADPLPKFKEAISEPSGRLTLLLTLTICLIGVTWQIATVSNDYFSYAVVSEVIIEKRKDVHPPAMSLCLPYADVVEEKQMSLMRANSDRQVTSMILQENLTVETLFKVTRPLGYFAESAWVRKFNSYNISIGWNQLNVIKFLKDHYACYKISGKMAEDPNYSWKSHHISFGRHPGAQMGFYLDKKKLKKVQRASIVLTDVNQFPRGDRDFPLNLFDDSGSHSYDLQTDLERGEDDSIKGNEYDSIFRDSATYWSLAYSKVTQELLPQPFATACRDYTTSGYTSRHDCIDQCINMNSMKEFNQSLFWVTFTEMTGCNMTVMSKRSLAKDNMQRRVDKIIDDCMAKVRSCMKQDCTKVYFIPILLSKLDDEQRVVVTLFDMNGPETRLLFHQK